MASRRMLPHTVRLFNYIGEVDDVAEYQESIIRFCYCTWIEGASSASSPSDSAKLYVFDANSIVTSPGGTRRTFVPPEEWSDCCGKAMHYTFSDNGNDYFQMETGEKFLIRHYRHMKAGSKRMWHFEVEGK